MAIKESGVSAVSVGTLLAQNLRIPEYQRPYSWQPATALQLVDDVTDARAGSDDVPYVLGAVILHKREGWLDVVDGQQRLLTLRMIFATLQSEKLLSADGTHENPALLVWRELQKKLARLQDAKKAELLHYMRTQCQLVRVVTDDVDEAFRVFDSQNYRGKSLAPHDLLKAHHLREMRGESAAMKMAVVEAWESAEDAKLDRLFSTFLYRIARWSRGESAPGFSIHDIGMFKGISHKAHGGLPPAERYHLAAQAAMPLLSTWAGLSDRDAGRCRFQLDAPLIAGRTFFEMVSFMLKELETLKEEAKEIIGEFGSTQSRYKYVQDLFIAALLYYTNKFGDEDLNENRERLFEWAYALRIELRRVQFVSLDNRARGMDDATQSAFILLRNAMTSRTVRRLNLKYTPYGEQHEQELIDHIQKSKAP